MLVVKYRRIFYVITTVLVVASIASISVFGLTFGIDFTGGTIMDLSYPNGRPAKVEVSERLHNFNIGNFSLRESGENGFILRTRELQESERQGILEVVTLNEKYPVMQERVSSVGPVIGEELRTKAIIALLATMVAIILFVAFVFRKVSKPVSSWKYGLIAIVALLHDILIPVGLFAALGYVTGAQVDVLFVMALLAILGYSVNDTIVVFDRVRENLRFNQETNRKEDFELTVGKSLTQTYTRSVNTSLTTLFGILALFFFGPVATQDFALVLIAGIVAGTYSSIFLATPLLVSLGGKGRKKA
ncbi:protein translocase subunit SecF [Candidatus Kaiserbacteria bacterium CG10_big_fil_rev_8_21_14_0_10_49_17]|uniref:Protein-export membrane protein SecF n=1 Tax=Candidatus Kaiserbacteria bacterium CG10_big_fil_rev_8_21_14_0_10_49_17 TaxID=1974609 RepID=A0A2M6WDS1_9BACT|nr:MAG: protein translocase subunit SecF [Candidatus Kaiserbacteria bacterium CG10_big_fil_rev_8_21_14_0_10_49_17]